MSRGTTRTPTRPRKGAEPAVTEPVVEQPAAPVADPVILRATEAVGNTAVERAPGPPPIDRPLPEAPPVAELDTADRRVWARYRHPATQVVAFVVDEAEPEHEGGSVRVSVAVLENLLREAGFDQQIVP